MNEHPVRLILSDSTERTRVTVFFRLLLAIPHYIWLALWGIVALVATVANWFATLYDGRSPAALHGFIASYIKYATQVHAYVNLAADPYPSFDGRDGYPVDLVFAPPARQSRWSVVFRLVLVIPALLLLGALVGSGSSAGKFSSLSGSFGLVHAAAFLGWFAILARGRMPRGLRDAAAYSLSFGAQFWAYALLVTDRYPNSDPLAALEHVPVRSDPVGMRVEDDLRRSRLTVFFRLLLAAPHLVWLGLWGMLALLAVFVNWFVVLISARPSVALHRFVSAYVRYQFHVYAFLLLVANPFPGFTGGVGSYPLELTVAAGARQNRWKTLFRLILVIPAWLLASAYFALVAAAAILGWFYALARGAMPLGLRNAAALGLRYYAQTIGYMYLLTDSYPYSGPSVNADGSPLAELTAPESPSAAPSGLPAPGAPPLPALPAPESPAAIPSRAPNPWPASS